MPTSLTNVSAHLRPIAQLLYTTPVGATAIALNTVVANNSGGTIGLNLYKQDVNGESYNLVPPQTTIYTSDAYRPPIEKLILKAEEKLYAAAGSATPQARATGIFGLPVILDPLVTGAIADISISLAERT